MESFILVPQTFSERFLKIIIGEIDWLVAMLYHGTEHVPWYPRGAEGWLGTKNVCWQKQNTK